VAQLFLLLLPISFCLTRPWFAPLCTTPTPKTKAAPPKALATVAALARTVGGSSSGSVALDSCTSRICYKLILLSAAAAAAAAAAAVGAAAAAGAATRAG